MGRGGAPTRQDPQTNGTNTDTANDRRDINIPPRRPQLTRSASPGQAYSPSGAYQVPPLRQLSPGLAACLQLPRGQSFAIPRAQTPDSSTIYDAQGNRVVCRGQLNGSGVNERNHGSGKAKQGDASAYSRKLSNPSDESISNEAVLPRDSSETEEILRRMKSDTPNSEYRPPTPSRYTGNCSSSGGSATSLSEDDVDGYIVVPPIGASRRSSTRTSFGGVQRAYVSTGVGHDRLNPAPSPTTTIHHSAAGGGSDSGTSVRHGVPSVTIALPEVVSYLLSQCTGAVAGEESGLASLVQSVTRLLGWEDASEDVLAHGRRIYSSVDRAASPQLQRVADLWTRSRQLRGILLRWSMTATWGVGLCCVGTCATAILFPLFLVMIPVALFIGGTLFFVFIGILMCVVLPTIFGLALARGRRSRGGAAVVSCTRWDLDPVVVHAAPNTPEEQDLTVVNPRDNGGSSFVPMRSVPSSKPSSPQANSTQSSNNHRPSSSRRRRRSNRGRGGVPAGHSSRTPPGSSAGEGAAPAFTSGGSSTQRTNRIRRLEFG